MLQQMMRDDVPDGFHNDIQHAFVDEVTPYDERYGSPWDGVYYRSDIDLLA